MVLSSSAAEAAAATRMDSLSHPNSTVQRCSPQSGGIPPASDAAVSAAPRARLGETNYLVGGGRNDNTTWAKINSVTTKIFLHTISSQNGRKLMLCFPKWSKTSPLGLKEVVAA